VIREKAGYLGIFARQDFGLLICRRIKTRKVSLIAFH